MSPLVGVLVSRRYASLRELEQYYSYEDALNLLEIARVNSHNERALMEQRRGNSH